MAIRKPEVSAVPTCTYWLPKGWWEVALSPLLWWTMLFFLGFLQRAEMLFPRICLFENLICVLSYTRWTELPGFTLLISHEYPPLGCEKFPEKIPECRTYFIHLSPALLQFFYAQVREKERNKMLTYCFRTIYLYINTTEDNWCGKYEYSIPIKEKNITNLLSDNCLEMWVGWYLSHVLLMGTYHKKSKIHYVLLFVCLCYWTVFSKIFIVAAFDSNTAMWDIGLYLEWRPYSRRLKGHFSSSSAVVFGFVEL